MFLDDDEIKLSDEYLQNGYIIRDAPNKVALDWIKDKIADIVRDILGISKNESSDELLNNIHKKVSIADLNNFRLKVIQSMNNLEDLRLNYFKSARPYLESLVGNELAMQLRINLSIQFPDDSSSLLPVHADTWSGDSPYEIVLWIPLVDCFKTKSMYHLSPKHFDSLRDDFKSRSGLTSEELYQSISKEVKFLEIKYGQVLLFDQGLPHGNRVNQEPETRWSMNCRFKGVFTPYGDKKIGEFFDPITLRATSRVGMGYKFPSVK